MKYEYCIPLISAQGEVSGRLKVELSKLEGSLPEDRFAGGHDDSSSEVSKRILGGRLFFVHFKALKLISPILEIMKIGSI